MTMRERIAAGKLFTDIVRDCLKTGYRLKEE
jgi:hypothetical protein